MKVIWTKGLRPVYFRLHEPPETQELFVPVADRIFGQAWRWPTLDDPENAPLFADRSWRAFAVHGRYDNMYCVMGEDHPEEEQLYVEENPRVTLPPEFTDEHMEVMDNALEDYYVATYADVDPLATIFRAMTEDGIDELIQLTETGYGPYAGHPIAATCCPLQVVVSQSRVLDDYLGYAERLLFDRSGRWGLFGDPDDFCIIAGAPDFIDPVIETLGGMEAVKARFEEDLVGSEGWQHLYRIKAVYDCVGWSYPEGYLGPIEK